MKLLAEILGYKVADVPEMLEHFTEDWQNYFDKKVDIDSVIAKHDQMGFHACCDLPYNGFYKELYDGMKDRNRKVSQCTSYKDIQVYRF